MKRFGKVVFVLLVSLALLGAMDVVNSLTDNGTIAEAAAKKAAKRQAASKTEKSSKKAAPAPKSSKKTATTTRVASKTMTLETRQQLDGVAKGGKWEDFPQYGCVKLVLGRDIVVSDAITLITTKDGKTAKTGTTIKKGTAVKVFFKKNDVEQTKQTPEDKKNAPSSQTPKATSVSADVVAPVIPTPAPRPEITANTEFYLAFAGLAEHKGKVVDGSELRSEADLCLIGTEFFRNSLAYFQFLLPEVKRDFIVPEDMFVTVYGKNGGKGRDMEPGQKVKKGLCAKISFRNPGTYTVFYRDVPEPVLVAETLNEPQEVAVVPVSTVSYNTYVYATEQLADLGVGVKDHPHYVDLEQVTDSFILNSQFKARARTRDGKWYTIEPDANGQTVVPTGTNHVRVFKNARNDVAALPR